MISDESNVSVQGLLDGQLGPTFSFNQLMRDWTAEVTLLPSPTVFGLEACDSADPSTQASRHLKDRTKRNIHLPSSVSTTPSTVPGVSFSVSAKA